MHRLKPMHEGNIESVDDMVRQNDRRKIDTFKAVNRYRHEVETFCLLKIITRVHYDYPFLSLSLIHLFLSLSLSLSLFL